MGTELIHEAPSLHVFANSIVGKVGDLLDLVVRVTGSRWVLRL